MPTKGGVPLQNDAAIAQTIVTLWEQLQAPTRVRVLPQLLASVPQVQLLHMLRVTTPGTTQQVQRLVRLPLSAETDRAVAREAAKGLQAIMERVRPPARGRLNRHAVPQRTMLEWVVTMVRRRKGVLGVDEIRRAFDLETGTYSSDQFVTPIRTLHLRLPALYLTADPIPRIQVEVAWDRQSQTIRIALLQPI